MNHLKAHRMLYAQLVTAEGGVDPKNTKLILAFTSVRREDYLGAGPWKIRTGVGYIVTPSDEPSLIYQNVLVALQDDADVNNGQPSLHARCLDALQISEGETIVHIGAGTGYYTAILSELVGNSGTIIAYEINKELAERAAENLESRLNVKVQGSSGTKGLIPDCDVIYVNAGATGPVEEWFDALKPNGRILFPLTPAQGAGGMLLLKQVDNRRFSASFISSAGFIPCIGARSDDMAGKLSEAFTKGGTQYVQSLHRGHSPDSTCWVAGEGWWLSTNPVA